MGIINNYIFTFTDKFKEAYSINPKKTLWKMKLCMLELGLDVDDPLLMKLKPILFNETYQLFAIFILIFILGIAAFKYFSLFLFGFIFFVAGFCCGTSNRGGTSNLIFLFSHGLTGLILMVAGMINETFKLYLDNSSYFAILIAAAIFFIFGFFNIVLANINSEFEQNGKKTKCSLYFLIGFIIVFVSTILIRLGVI